MTMKKIFLIFALIFSQSSLASSLVFKCKPVNDHFSRSLEVESVILIFKLDDKDLAVLSRIDKSSGIREFANYYHDSTEDTGVIRKLTFTRIGEPDQKLDIVIKSESFNHLQTLEAELFVYDEQGIQNANDLLCQKRP